MNSTAADWLSAAEKEFGRHFETPRIGVAVSGGGDSMALLALLSDWCAAHDRELLAVSVDHGLRTEAVSECTLARDFANSRGHRHSLLTCSGVGQVGNLQREARRARYAAIANWAKGEGIAEVALAHTRNDQAETFLLNLARGSGVDGLSAMQPRVRRHGLFWVRPLLKVGRADLREHLVQRGLAWAEDPSNQDLRFDRVKARQMLDLLAPLGLDAERLAETSIRIQAARRVLELEAGRVAREVASVNRLGEITFAHRFWDLQDETGLRLVSQALKFISGAEYRPRLASLSLALASARSGGKATLSGCILSGLADGRLRVGREPAACPPRIPVVEVWDGRWQMEGGAGSGELEVGALGPGGSARMPGLAANREFEIQPALLAGSVARRAAGFRAAGGIRPRLVSEVACRKGRICESTAIRLKIRIE